jgi:hypothetical protein
MFARVNTAQGAPEKLDAEMDAIRVGLQANPGQVAGFKGAHVLVDRGWEARDGDPVGAPGRGRDCQRVRAGRARHAALGVRDRWHTDPRSLRGCRPSVRPSRPCSTCIGHVAVTSVRGHRPKAIIRSVYIRPSAWLLGSLATRLPGNERTISGSVRRPDVRQQRPAVEAEGRSLDSVASSR